MTAKAIYILWEQPEAQNLRQEYVGGGCYATRADVKMVTKRVRWSSEATPERMAQAEQYIKDNMQDDRQNVRAVIVNDV